MLKRLLLMSALIAFITGCESQEDTLYSLSSMVEEKKPIGTIDIREGQIIHANEEAKTSKKKKIDDFKSLIAGIKLKQVKKSSISELSNKYANEDKMFSIALANKKNRKDVLIIELTSDGKGLVVSFENGGSTDEMYEIQNGNPNLYEEVHEFYKSIYKEITIEQN
ncbi:hypothetical protein SAMN05216353_102126 [Halobacillus alkaliphilus]|uniref:Uncharacterized protein n=1 Tax=Halobacillus alkaliphilus TaxID=396056 RepID=A0A1I2JYQ5_9BACI|nr:hypothetical protein [Halobacillus alkaliphilus]SFF57876.1 hypothetical protein SAMN05216353_102126 [Halobacillus alkaliphilus]